MKSNTAIILPLKESFSDNDFGAVSIWVNYYLTTLIKKMIIFFVENSQEITGISIKSNSNFSTNKIYTNLQYIKN